jgi:uncharacterized membrane protein
VLDRLKFLQEWLLSMVLENTFFVKENQFGVNLMEKNKEEPTEKENMILALALIKHLYNKGDISEYVYKNIKKEYVKKIEKS